MRKILISGIALLLFLLSVSCICTPPVTINNNNTTDTTTGWVCAGITSPGDYGQHIDVCHYKEHMFTFNYRGELFYCIYPDFSWTKMDVPNGDTVYCIYCDTVYGMLYVSTRGKCGVFEYSIVSRQWRELMPKKNSWFDSTKLYDGKLNVSMYNITCYNNMLYIMTVQRWGGVEDHNSYPRIWRSNKDTNWTMADSGWPYKPKMAVTITDFFPIDNYLYATTFDQGLWRYDGVSWKVVPGTTPEEIQALSLSGGDTRSIPGFRPRSVAKHNNDIYVGNLTGEPYKMLSGDKWEKKFILFFDYGFNKVVDYGNPVMCLYSFNGYLSRGTYYFNDSANMWFNMTPNFNKIDTMFNNGLPGKVYGMTHIGDTLFAALGDDYGVHSGVYYLDLKKCKWYRKYR